MAEKASLYPREKEFFQLCPSEFVDTMYKVVANYATLGTEELASGLKAAYKIDNENTELNELIRQASEKYMNSVQQIFKKNFDKFELYVLRNIFTIPKDLNFHAMIAEENQSSEMSNNIVAERNDKAPIEDEKYLEEEITDLQRQLRQEIDRNETLLTEELNLQQSYEQFNSIIKQIKFVQDNNETTYDGIFTEALELQNAIKRINELQEYLNERKVQEVDDSNCGDSILLEDLTQQYLEHSSGLVHTSLADITKLNSLLMPSK